MKPHGAQGSAEKTIARCRESRVGILDEALERGIGRFHKHEVFDARFHPESARAALDHSGRLPFNSRFDECRRMRYSAAPQMLPGLLLNADFRLGDLRIAVQKEATQFVRELLDALGGRLSREGIDDVLHRIGGKDPAVVSVGKAWQKITLEQNVDGPFLELVDRPASIHSHQANAGLSVAIDGQIGGHVSFLDTWCTR
jgi:hypothetical protein